MIPLLARGRNFVSRPNRSVRVRSALIQANLVAHFPAEELTALLAEAAGEIDLITGANKRRERRQISIDDWRRDVG